MNAGFTALTENNRNLDGGLQRSCNWGPQTSDEKYSDSDCSDLKYLKPRISNSLEIGRASKH